MNFFPCFLTIVSFWLYLMPMGLNRPFIAGSAIASTMVFSSSDSSSLLSKQSLQNQEIANSLKKVDAMLENTWQLVQWEDEKEAKFPILKTEITAQFSDNRVSGSGGCNNYTGSYQATEQQLKIGELAATLEGCQPEIMERELRYLAALRGAQSFEIREADNLRIFYQTAEDSGVLVFKSFDSQTQGGAWLDQKTSNWNQYNRTVPRGPIQEGSNLSKIK